MSREASVLADRRMLHDVGAVVLGGGRGTRLHPLTAERAKPAVPVGGRYRLVDIPLSNCLHSGINRIFVMTQFNSASLNRHITHSYKFDVFSGGFVEILAAQQTAESGSDWYQGTADAVRKHLSSVMDLGAAHYLILSGDQLYRMDYSEMLATHIKSDAAITVAALPVSKQAAREFGVMKVQRDGRIKEFVEKPQTADVLKTLRTPTALMASYGLEPKGREYLASMGVYIFRADVMELVMKGERNWIDFGKDVIPKSLESRRVYAHLFSGYWEDIGTIRSYYDASIEMTQPDAPFPLHDAEHPIYSRPRYLPGSILHNTHVKNSVICEGSKITGASISSSIIGIRTRARSDVTIDRSVIMGADFFEDEGIARAVPLGIGKGSLIRRAIVDKNACIGKGVSIIGSNRLKDDEGDGWVIRDGIVVVLKNAVIPDGTIIGVGRKA
jgi:glucose-1-phosphate adenylyltransferase